MPLFRQNNDSISEKREVSRFFSLNIGTIVFGAILVYILISLVLFLTQRHVQYYQVTSGPLTRNQTYTGIAIRSEQVITTDTSGYVTYYAQGDARVRRGGMLFGISAQKNEGGSAAMSESAVREVREAIRDFSLNYDSIHYHNVYELKYDITGKIVSDVPILTDEMQASLLGDRSTYTIGNQTVTACPKDGVVVYMQDGYEDLTQDDINAALFNEKIYHQKELRTADRLEAGDPVLKIVDAEEWSVIIPLSPLQLVRLDGITDIRVKFLKDGVTSLATLDIFSPEDGQYYGRLTFKDGMIRYVSDRFIDIELVTNTQTGLKVPISSIVSKDFFTIPENYATVGEDGSEIGFMRELRAADGSMTTEFVSTTMYEHKDGKYYIDSEDFSAGDVIVMKNSDGDRYIIRNTDSLEGVYCTNKGYAVFRKITILDKNEEYCIVEAGTRYGISQFDFIVLNSDEVGEEEIVAR